MDTDEGKKPLKSVFHFFASQFRYFQLEIEIKIVERKIAQFPLLFHKIWPIFIGVSAPANQFFTLFLVENSRSKLSFRAQSSYSYVILMDSLEIERPPRFIISLEIGLKIM